MTDVLIPALARKAVTSPASLTGTLLTGQTLTGDTWVDHPLELAGDAAQVFTGALIAVETTGYLDLPQESAEVIVTTETTVGIDITGMLDLPRETADVQASRNVILAVEASGQLDLAGDAGIVYTERNVTLTSEDSPLELDGCLVKLTIEVVMRIAVDAVIPLDLDGVEHVRVNPILMPFECLDLDAEAITCTPLDLALVAAELLDLDVLVCLHQGDQWTILNTFESGERVLRGGGDGIFTTPLPEPEVLDLQPVGCDDR